MKKRTGKMISLSLAVAMAMTAAPVTALAVDEPVLTTAQNAGETETDTTTVDTNEEEGTAWTTLSPSQKVEEEAMNVLPEVTETEKTVQGEGTKENPYQVSKIAIKETVKNGGYLQMSDDFEINDTLVIENDVNLDLNGKTLTCSSEKIGIQVKSGSTLIEDSADNGKITTSNMSTILVKVSAGAEFTLNSGTLENTNGDFSDENVILNYGTLNIDGGVIKGVSCIHANASQYETTAPTEEKSIVNITNGQLIGTPCKTDIQHENKYTDISYGLTWFGLGMGENGIYNKEPDPINDAVVINISGGKISGGQALGTNASSGKYAGFTLNISDDAEIVSSNDCAAYLPGYCWNSNNEFRSAQLALGVGLQISLKHYLKIIKIRNHTSHNRECHLNRFRRLLIHCISVITVGIHLILIHQSDGVLLVHNLVGRLTINLHIAGTKVNTIHVIRHCSLPLLYSFAFSVAVVRAVTDNNVIHKRDAKKRSALRHSLCHCIVLRRRGGITAGMIVHQHNLNRTFVQCSEKNLAR